MLQIWIALITIMLLKVMKTTSLSYNSEYLELKEGLKTRMEEKLKEQEDPRIFCKIPYKVNQSVGLIETFKNQFK